MSTLLEHANMVKLKVTYEDEENIPLVMELCTGGNSSTRSLCGGTTTSVKLLSECCCVSHPCYVMVMKIHDIPIFQAHIQ
ncbi:hypothetical protein JHK84_028070 [Glycine max]|nr:hypothetical protein JHK85_028486 [Glycine max]KAG5003817.1 hypothetical protein JHK86_027956 [Glycine max]KAG5151598.1 hypothetical protein JHK84_028070 [Glycine max]